MRSVDARYRQELDDGRKVTYTVEPALQRFSDDLFERYQVPAGAAVLLNSRTGRVLALSNRRALEQYAPDSAVALDSSPPAASLFKIVTAAALLEEGNVSPGTRTCYRGGASKLLMEHLAEPPDKNRACASLTAALGRSINAIFARLSDQNLKRDTLLKYAGRFGFNRPIPFDVDLSQSTADIPRDRLERARTAAGFWHTHLSPMHGAVIMQSLAQRGSMLRPYVVEKVENRDGKTIYEAQPRFIAQTVSDGTAAQLVEALTFTVKHGTAQKAFHDKRGIPYLTGVDVAGKTGTLHGKKPYRAYTWFAGIAPADKPEVAICVLVVNEPKWRIKASTAASLLLQKYFETKAKGK